MCGGVHGHQAIVLLFLHVGTVDRVAWESVQQRHIFNQRMRGTAARWLYTRLTCAPICVAPERRLGLSVPSLRSSVYTCVYESEI